MRRILFTIWIFSFWGELVHNLSLPQGCDLPAILFVLCNPMLWLCMQNYVPLKRYIMNTLTTLIRNSLMFIMHLILYFYITHCHKFPVSLFIWSYLIFPLHISLEDYIFRDDVPSRRTMLHVCEKQLINKKPFYMNQKNYFSLSAPYG